MLTILSIIAVLVFVPIFLENVLSVSGYYITGDEDALAKFLVKEGKDASECYKLLQMDLGPHPSDVDKRRGCVYTYAQLTKDPKVCERLLPSDYGLSCIGTIWSLLSDGCSSYSDGQILCGSGISDSSKKGIDDCNVYTHPLVRDWCYTRRSAVLKGVNDCSKVSVIPPSLQYECKTLIAFKEKNEKLCSEIADEKWKYICEQRIRIWVEHPEMRSSSYFGESAESSSLSSP